ncbi:PadR family transcriptional regulator [Planctomonas sp. JC2975]|nr:PadR family transcriptional regulator [Planctomonas sp. JC2975]
MPHCIVRHVDEEELQRREISDAHRQELNRGSVVLASLLALRNPGYGYALLETLDKAGIPVAGNTLYPLLRRLESQGLLTSEWDTTESRPRKFYRTSRDGELLARSLLAEWRRLGAAIDSLDTTEGTQS